MARSSDSTRRASRFDQLTPDQEKIFQGETASLLLTGKLRSFTGKKSLRPFFEAALKGYVADVGDFHDAVALIDGFVLMCNARKVRHNRAFQGFRTHLNGGLLTFARARGLHTKPLGEWPVDLGAKLSTWLDQEALTKNGKRLSKNTGRRYHGDFCSLFAELGERAKTASKLPELESFPNNPFSGANDETVKTKSLGLPTLIAILLAARTEFLNAVEKVRHAQALFKGPEVLPDLTSRAKFQYRDIDALLWSLHKTYPDRFPPYTSWRQTEHDALFEAINKLHGGWREVGEYFHPFPHSCVAPMLLLTIYGHFNVEPLRALRLRQVQNISVLRNEHIEVRTAVQPGKNRGAAYRRSFPVDNLDFASPSSILSLMMDWTSRIRRDAGKYSDCTFISMTNEGEVRAFATATLDGRSGDSKWIHHLRAFCKRHNLPAFNLSELRQTSLDFGRLISEEDIREIAALKGGSSESVLDFHYRSDAAESRAHATIGGLQANKERHVRSNGKSHHLGAQSKDVTAATPGCSCVDPYDSPIPGEVRGALCGAFGCCPGCPHGSPQLGSAHALARLLQLREELTKAKSNIPMERWIVRYKRSLEALEGSWLPMFDDPQLWEHVTRMSLQPIGVIE